MLKPRYKTVYMASPCNYASGGPELLFQTARAIRDRGGDARLFFFGATSQTNPIHDEFKKYDVPYVFSLSDDPDALLVIPEVYTGLIFEYPRIQKCIWWMSVDNYYRSIPKAKRWYDKIRFFFAAPKYFKIDTPPNIPLKHFYQSEYARLFLLEKGISSPSPLSDYLNDEFFEITDEDPLGKEDWVAYNPKKGKLVTAELQRLRPDLHWKPIKNMTRREVVDLLRKAKVYIDFGSHPGKDRIPREAAVAGCVVITGKAGAAGNPVDVPLPDDYKFAEDQDSLANALGLIDKIFVDYDQHRRAMEPYRTRILGEKQQFLKEVQGEFFY